MSRPCRFLCFLFGAVAFSLAYTQAPLYYSNQNQYFLHGLAEAERGRLAGDWLANTASPTPVFDSLVRVTVKYGHESFFYIYYALLMGLYFVSLMGIFDHLVKDRATPRLRLAYAAFLFFIHSAFLRWLSYRVFEADYVCYFQGWLAAQYVLGPVFQPSTAGVFLLVAVERFINKRYFIAFTAVSLAGIGHSTYLLPGGILTLTFAGMLTRERSWQKAWILPLWSLALVLPTILHAYSNFRPTTPAQFAEAQRILAVIRIPHHCDPRRWFDAITGVQIAGMILGILAARRTRLFPVLSILFIASLVLTLVQLATDSHTLALLFPWRSSVILIPLAVSTLLARLVLSLPQALESVTAKCLNVAAMAALCTAGVLIMALHEGYASNTAEEPLMAYVRSSLQSGDRYLLPVQLPKSQGAKGSVSSDFKPLPAQQADKRLIPLDFQRFRLATGAPIYVDFKAIPYRDTDVLEWFRRVEWNQWLYVERDWNATTAIADVKAAGITHVVVAKNQEIRCDGVIAVYEDENYKVYRVMK